MSSRRIVVFTIIMMLVLSGCYRQASDDTFESSDDQNGQDTPVPAVDTPIPTPETPVTVIVPDTDVEEPTADGGLPFDTVEPTTDGAATQVDIQSLSATPITGNTTDLTPVVTQVTPFGVPTSTPTQFQAQVQPTTGLLPTATSVVITPEPPGNGLFPTNTPSPSPTVDPNATASILSTPTALAEQVTDECIHVVQPGENLFRIAFNNNVSLEDMRTVNGIVGDIIQPGDRLVIPGCVSTPVEDTGTTVTDTTPVPTGATVHVVRAGETMGGIARQYGVTINAILTANGLTNPDVLSVNQELIIPPPSP